MDHCQIGVLLAYASARGQALLDRARYLPKEWTQERARCTRAGMPAEQLCATKPALARRMLEQAFQAGVPAAWVTGESGYGHDRRRRMWRAAQERASGLAVSGQEDVWLGGQHRQVQTLRAHLPTEGWQRHSAGAGAQGPRCYAWYWLPLADPMPPAWRRWLVVRRRLREPTELTASVVFAPPATPVAAAVQGAGARWTIESSCEAATGAGGVDHYAVRRWPGW